MQGELFPRPETTAVYPNRIRDKQKVEAELGLAEPGNEITRFFTPNGVAFAKGYVRIVYGDHGPYIEFRRDQILAELRRKFDRPLPAHCFYEWLYPVGAPDVKAYDQKKTVEQLKNPPAGGFRGSRNEGYADYKVGMIYVDPFQLKNENGL